MMHIILVLNPNAYLMLQLTVITHLALVCDGKTVQRPNCYMDHLLPPEALHHGGLPDVLVRPVTQPAIRLTVTGRDSLGIST